MIGVVTIHNVAYHIYLILPKVGKELAMRMTHLLAYSLIFIASTALAKQQCTTPKDKANPYLLSYNCSLLDSNSFKTLIGFGGAWQQHLATMKAFLNQDCLGIDKFINEKIENKANQELDRSQNPNIRLDADIDNSRTPSSTQTVIDAIYGGD